MSDPGSEPAPRLHHTPASGTVPAGGSGDMSRRAGISGDLCGSEAIWMGQNRLAAGARSADHHHGRSETGIYVVSGHPVFVWADGDGEARIETGPGDYVWVPPFTAHREENPGGEEAVVVLARSTQEGITVNLTDLHAPVERSV